MTGAGERSPVLGLCCPGLEDLQTIAVLILLLVFLSCWFVCIYLMKNFCLDQPPLDVSVYVEIFFLL